jgi:dipeptidyl-peptidase-4
MIWIAPLLAQDKVPQLEEIWKEAKYRAQGAGIDFMNDGQRYTEKRRGQGRYQLIVAYSIEDSRPVDTLFNTRWVIDNIDTLEQFSFQKYSFSENNQKILLKQGIESIYRRSTRENNYVWDTKKEQLIPLSTEHKQRSATFSPDGEKIAYTMQNDLYIKDLSSTEVTRVTKDGEKNKLINGTTDWVYEEEFAFTKAFFWAPDNEKIAYYKFDESHVKQFTMPIYRGLYPQMYEFKYPKAGGRNSLISLHIYHLEDEQKVKVDVSQGKSQFSEVYDFDRIDQTWEYVPRIKWTPNPDQLCVQRMNRHQNRLDLMLADASSGETEILFTETNDTYISVHDNLTFLQDSDQFLWTSEQSGYNQIYLYNMQGDKVQQITAGAGPVTKFYGYDPSEKVLYYQSAEVSPLERHVYRINLQGNNKQQLSEEKGTHDFTFDPTFSYFLHEFSNVHTPPRITLHHSNGAQIRMMENNEALRERLEDYNLTKKEFFSFTTEQDVKLNGWMMKPPSFDESEQYPVLMYVYGGPGSQTVQNKWGRSNYFWYQHLTNQGYIIVSVDNRGTGARTAEFKKMTYKELGKYETKDQIAAAEYLKQKNYVAPERIGIWGWSYGGYMSSLCLMKGHATFNLAIAVAPLANWRFYDTIYTERFMQTPQENPEGYDDNSPINFVDSLRGDYLWVHGSADDNVHYQNGMEMINALVRANKPFQFMVYPNRDHSIFGGNARLHLYNKMTNFLKERL